MSTNNCFYNKLDKKILISLASIIALYFFFCVITCYNMSENMNFYRNAKHIGSIVKNIKEKEDGNRIIRVTYIVNKKTYNKDIEYNVSELGELEIGDTVSIFYNSTNPNEAHITTRTVGSVLLIMILLITILVILVLCLVYYYLRIKMNIKLINDNNFIMAKFQRLEFKNSMNPFSVGRVNRVYCKAKINGEKTIFKSIGFTGKPKPLNDTSMIKVYINKDDIKKYLVELDSIIDIGE